jgi:hypothetical protein
LKQRREIRIKIFFLQILKIRLRKDSSIKASVPTVDMALIPLLSYPIFMPKPSTHRMHDLGSIVPHIRPKVFTYNQMSQIKYNYYINSVSKDYDDSQ